MTLTRLTERLRRLAMLASVLVLGATAAAAFEIDAMTEAEREAFRAEVRAYLLDHPEVIMEAVQILQQRQQARAGEAERNLIAAHAGALFDDGHSYVGGNPDGDVTLVEFLDYRCGYCRKAHPEVAELLRTDGNIRWIVKEFPILGDDSVRASRFAIATRNVAGPEAYRAVHDALMEMRGAPSLAALKRLGESLGLDTEAIVAAMDDKAVSDEIDRNHALARALQINGTPTFVTEDRILRGYVPLDTMRQIVAEIRGSEG